MSSPSLSRAVSATFTAPTNIAVIKYWGKRDSKYNLPINSSVSVTLDQDDLCAMTTIIASPDFDKDRLWLNGVEEDVASNKRVVKVLAEARKRSQDRVDDSGVAVSGSELAAWPVRIVSRNTFPTAAGLASSAAGYACMVATLSEVFGMKASYEGEITTLARMGSGSACRSLYGGFVRWAMGTKDDGADSIAQQVAPESHWPELQVIICVVSDKKKETGSTLGMNASVATSELLRHRATDIVPKRLEAMEAAYLAKDFPSFAKIAMQDSNQFHATCLDSYPPIFYMNDTSRRIVSMCTKLNSSDPAMSVRSGMHVGATEEEAAGIVVGYTFDAGPNAVLFCLKKDTKKVLAALLANFPPPEGMSVSEYVRNPADALASTDVDPASLPAGVMPSTPQQGGDVSYIYHTTVGDGPRQLGAEGALADLSTGEPKELA
jgi:diphosphomevalonate decarboxylase